MMDIQEIFKTQIAGGATEMFFYLIEHPEPYTLRVARHRGTLDSFPTNLQFIRMITDSNPLFKEVDN